MKQELKLHTKVPSFNHLQQPIESRKEFSVAARSSTCYDDCCRCSFGRTPPESCLIAAVIATCK